MAGSNVPQSQKGIFVEASRKYHIPAWVLAGVADVESNLGANASTSSAGAVGEMQFLPSTARSLGVNPFNLRSAIFGTAKYLNQLGYQSNAMRALGAYNGGPGNPQYGYAQQVMSSANRLKGQFSGVNVPSVTGMGGSSGKGPGRGRGGNQSTSLTVSGGQPDVQAAGIAALFAGADKPISSSGKFTSDNLLSNLMSNIDSGQFTTPTQVNKTTTINNGGPAAQGHPAPGPAPLGHFAGYVNPVTGAAIGRTDMGLDVSGLRNGAPIRAIGDSKVVGISPNWFRGQPYVLFQFLNGPHKGRYYYIAEAINPSVRPGQTVRAGQVVGTYNLGGTGLEIGWGSSTPGRTQAQATTGYTEGQVTPAGVDFTRFFHSLR